MAVVIDARSPAAISPGRRGADGVDVDIVGLPVSRTSISALAKCIGWT